MFSESWKIFEAISLNFESYGCSESKSMSMQMQDSTALGIFRTIYCLLEYS
jgi:hypothetical protein